MQVCYVASFSQCWPPRRHHSQAPKFEELSLLAGHPWAARQLASPWSYSVCKKEVQSEISLPNSQIWVFYLKCDHLTTRLELKGGSCTIPFEALYVTSIFSSALPPQTLQRQFSAAPPPAYSRQVAKESRHKTVSDAALFNSCPLVQLSLILITTSLITSKHARTYTCTHARTRTCSAKPCSSAPALSPR